MNAAAKKYAPVELSNLVRPILGWHKIWSLPLQAGSKVPKKHSNFECDKGKNLKQGRNKPFQFAIDKSSFFDICTSMTFNLLSFSMLINNDLSTFSLRVANQNVRRKWL